VLAFVSQLIFIFIFNRYRAIAHQQNLNLTYQNEDVKIKIIGILEEIKGCIQGTYLLFKFYLSKGKIASGATNGAFLVFKPSKPKLDFANRDLNSETLFHSLLANNQTNP
jgi:hypothetical protein